MQSDPSFPDRFLLTHNFGRKWCHSISVPSSSHRLRSLVVECCIVTPSVAGSIPTEHFPDFDLFQKSADECIQHPRRPSGSVVERVILSLTGPGSSPGGQFPFFFPQKNVNKKSCVAPKGRQTRKTARIWMPNSY
jgi:hypothetical protein